ncbi:hypothetical protein H4R20_003941 [Coemansia guatemalensis]|uniref:ARM repeat-containing protein n=1 Tax=Coemansia guatemalensis TaxID=2761395 RepID=A0A9W8HSW2_9FUNG|nr:hypothetical protein H4R20_003941 [Coemansia guatemalensis]
MDVGDSVGRSATADQQQQQQQTTATAAAAVGLQPLFDSSISLPQDGSKYEVLSGSTSPAGGQALAQTMYSPPQADNGGASIFGRLPTSVAGDSTLAPRLQSSVAAASAAHSRTASYGTSLLDTLNEEKQLSTHQRHFTLSSAFSLTGDGQRTAVSPPGLSAGGGTGRERVAAHVRAHTLNASPPGLQKAQGAATNASGMLGAHARLGSLSGLGTTSPPAAAGLSAGLGASGLLASSALRSSYSSNSLRTMFGRRSSPQPASGGVGEAAGLGSAASVEFSQALDEGVWGPSGLSNELDILATPDGSQSGLGDRMGRQLSLDDAASRQLTLDDAMKHQLSLDDAASRQLSLHDAMSQAHRRSGSVTGNETMARMRSYSFAGAPDGAESGEEADIDVLHAAATAQNPALAFRRLVARTHARSKTLASPLANGAAAAAAQRRTSHARQASDSGAGTVHVGIGGESVAGVTSVQHSRQASQVVAHSRQHSVDADFGAAGDGVPTRSLWVGNVDPGLSSQDLVAQFGKYGRVESLRLLPDKECAFVNFLRVEDAVRAREAMHAGARIGGNTVRVGFGKGEAHATGDAQAMQPTRALWIGNIAAAAAADQLGSVFGRFGEIESARVLNHKNCGFVNFVRLEDAVRAKQAMNGKSIDGAVVRIGYAKVPPAKTDAALKLRNPVPAAAPLTASGARAEAAASRGTTQCGLGSRGALEPGVSLAVNEDLVAFPYAPHIPHVPSPAVAIRADGDTAPGRLPLLPQARLRELRRQLDAGTVSRDAFARITAELLPHAVDLCTDYVGNVLVQRMAERGDAALRLSLVRRIAPHMAAIGIHKNGTWAVQKLIDCADTPAQRRLIVRALRPYTPQLLLDQLGNYVVQGCLNFGAPAGSASDAGDGAADSIADTADSAEPAADSAVDSTDAAAAAADTAAAPTDTAEFDPSDPAAADPNDPTDADSSNQFVFDAIHARCLDVAQGRFGARAVRTCLESPHASRMQQKLVAVSLVTNAATLATNANGHLLMNWLLDSSRFAGRFRVLAHQLAPHLRYLATHKLGASTVTKLVDQSHEPDARDLILNTLFYNPDPTVLEDVLADQSQGVHVVLRVLQGAAIGDAEKARLAERLRPVLGSPSARGSAAPASSGGANSSVSPVPSSNGASRTSPGVSASQRLADVVAGILAHSQPAYPLSGHRASVGAASASPPAIAAQQQQQQTMPSAQHYQAANAQQQPMGFHMMPPHMSAGAVAMSFPVGSPHPQAAHIPPAGFGGMAGPGQLPPFGSRTLSADLLAAPFYHPQQLQHMPPHDAAANMYAPMDFGAAQRSAMPIYPSYAAEMYPPVSSATPPQPQSLPPSAKPDTTPPVETKE